MADQRETISYEAIDNTAPATKTANANIVSVEKAATSATEKVKRTSTEAAEALVTVTDKSAKSIERTVLNVERRVIALKSPLERLALQQASTLERVGGDAAAVTRVTAAYEKLINAQRRAQQEEQSSKFGANFEKGLKQSQTIAAQLEQQSKRTGQALSDFIRNPLDGIANAVDGVSAKWGAFGLVAGAVGVAAVGAATQLFSMVKSASDSAEQIANLGDELGVTTGEIQILSRQAAIAGVDIETFIGIQRKLSDTLASGGATNQAAIKRLDDMGVQVVKAGGGFRGTIDILRDFSAQLNRFPDHATKVAVLTDVFGRSGIALLPLIEHFEELEQKAQEVGPVLQDEVIQRLAAANDKLDQLGLSWARVKLALAEKIVGVVEILTKGNGGAGGPGTIGYATRGPQPPTVRNDGIDPARIASPPEIDEALVRGAKLIERFKGRQTIEGFNRELAQLQTQQNAVGATIQSGLSDTAARAAIQQFDAISRRIETVKGQIKSMTDLPGKVQQAHEFLLNAQAAEQTGLGKIYIERQKAIAQYKGIPKAINDIEAAFQIRVQTELKQLGIAQRERAERRADEQSQLAGVRAQAQVDEILRTAAVRRQTAAEAAQTDIAQLDIVRDAQLRNLEAINAQTIAGQIAIDQERANIEAGFQERRRQQQAAVIESETNQELQRLQFLYDRKIISESSFQSAREALAAAADAKIAALRVVAEANIEAARENAQIQSNRRIVDHLQGVFAGFKRQAEGIFDATIKSSDGFFKAFGNSLKTFGLTALKDSVTNQAAGFLTQLTTGQRPQFVTEGGSGPLGKIAAALGIGAKPVFGGAGGLGDVQLVRGAVPVVLAGAGAGFGTPPFLPGGSGGGGLFGSLGGLGTGGGGGFGGLLGNLGAPGTATTPTFTSGPGTGAGGGGFGGLLSGGLASIKQSLASLGNLGGRTISAGGTPTFIPKGTGGAAGGAMLLGGGILAADGLRRGGLAGLGETAAGGALIGAKFGGPVGALIGGAIGAAAGTVRLFIKGKAEKIVDKVQALYGIRISKSFAADPLQKMIDGQFGGDIDFGLRQPSIVSLLRSWSQQSNQNFALEDKPYAVGLSLSGGVFRQTAARENGVAIAYGGGVAPIAGNPGRLITGSTSASSGAPATLVVENLSISMDGKSAQSVLLGGMAKNPDVVSRANLAGIQSSYGRNNLTSALLEPGTISR